MRLAKAGPRPAASRAEARAHALVKRVFTRAGLKVAVQRFAVAGRGRSRNVIGVYDTPARCLRIVMAHTDSTPNGPGANDNASGVGVLTELAPRLRRSRPSCDVWLVATGAEERVYTGSPDHLGALALSRRVRARGWHGGCAGRCPSTRSGAVPDFWLRSSARGVRRKVEGELLTGGPPRRRRVRWVRDEGSGNSDHREFQIAGLPAAKLGVGARGEPCRHMPCDRAARLQPRALSARPEAGRESTQDPMSRRCDWHTAGDRRITLAAMRPLGQRGLAAAVAIVLAGRLAGGREDGSPAASGPTAWAAPRRPTPSAAARATTASPGAAARTSCFGQRGRDRINGGRGNDRVDGGTGADRLKGASGRDRVRGRSGNDRLYGDTSADRMAAGSGNDLLRGGSGNDRLAGGSGGDQLFGDAGNDVLFAGRPTGPAGSGDDLFGGAGNDRLRGDTGIDRVEGGPGNDNMTGGADEDDLVGGSGNDRIDARDNAEDTIDCGPGEDTVIVDLAEDGVTDCETVVVPAERAAGLP